MEMEAWICNDTHSLPDEAHLHYQLEIEGRVLQSGSAPAIVPRCSSAPQGYIRFQLPDCLRRTAATVRLALVDKSGSIISDSAQEIEIFPKLQPLTGRRAFIIGGPAGIAATLAKELGLKTISKGKPKALSLIHISAAPWPGTTNGWQNSVEIDLMEYYGGTSYGSALHNWIGFYGPFSDNNTHTLWSASSYGGYSNTTNVWHTYGCLMVPSWQTTNGMGYLKMYLDNVFVTGFTVTWRNPTNLYTTNPNATNTPSGSDIYSTSELWHRIVTLGTAKTNSPMDVDWVRVWQPVTMTPPRLQTNGFGFYVGGYHVTNVLQACTNLASPAWQPIQTNSINSYETNSNSYLNNPLNANPVNFSDSKCCLLYTSL